MATAWKLKDMGKNGEWWIRHVGKAILSVAANKNAHRHHLFDHWWRVKIGSNIIFDGSSESAEEGKTAAEAEVRKFITEITSDL